MKTLKDFVRENLHCSFDKAEEFISKFRYYDAANYGRSIVENNIDNFTEGFNIEEISEETFASIAIRFEDDCLTDISVIEDRILKDVFEDRYV